MAKKEGTRKERVKMDDTKPRSSDKKRSSSRRLLLIIGAALAVAVIGMAAAARFFSDAAQLPGEAASSAAAPDKGFFSNVLDSIAEYFRSLKYVSNLEYEHQQVLAKKEELMAMAMMEEEYRNQRDGYTDMAEDMKRNERLSPIYADVVWHDAGSYFTTLTLNRGSADGVENNSAVIFGGGLVGYTYDVKENSCSVRTIIDSDSNIPALLEATRDQGTVRGTMGDDGQPTCRMYYLSEQHLPRAGDMVVTSGVGLEFLKDVPIGTVRESTRGLDDNKQYIVIEPIVDFAHLEYVTIYRYKPLYAEEASSEDVSSIPDLQTLATARPIPTFAVGVGTSFESGVTATPDPDATPAPSPSPSPSPSPTVDPNITAPPPNLGYLRPDSIVSGTATPAPTSSPTPSPTPGPTFNPDELTVEDE